MRLLVIAPGAPPKNAPESIQVGRYLRELCRRNEVTLVTTPVERGWVRADPALAMEASPLARIELRLPLHAVAMRLLSSRLARRWRVPDKDFWIVPMADRVRASLDAPPDVIYSRSTPFSSALLGRALADALRRPWVMHLSDPWADNPYRARDSARDVAEQTLEAECFASASAITVTTGSLAAFYARKYPLCAGKLAVSPNVLPAPTGSAAGRRDEVGAPLRIVYAGALYHRRRPTPLLDAMRLLKARGDVASGSIEILIAGNVTPDIEAELRATGWPEIRLLGHLDQTATRSVLDDAHVLVSLEADGEHELLKSFFPSKLLDYLAARRPILAIAPRESEASRLCAEGYGWSHEPADVEGIATRLRELSALHRSGRWGAAMPETEPPARLQAAVCASALESLFMRLVADVRSTNGDVSAAETNDGPRRNTRARAGDR
jgi:glycosyltransferase involved in cell wall biosynthesis